MQYLLVRKIDKFLPKRDRWQIVLLAFMVLLIFAEVVQACSMEPDKQIELSTVSLFLNISVIFQFFSLPLLAIILIETFILSKRESIIYIKAFGLSILTNIFTLLMTFLIGILHLFHPVFLFVIAGIFGTMFGFIDKRTNYLSNKYEFKLKRLTSSGSSFIIFLIFMSINQMGIYTFAYSTNAIALFAVMAGVFLSGFVFNVLAKGFILALTIGKKHPMLVETAFSMNVASFPVLAFTLFLMTNNHSLWNFYY